MSNGTQYGDGVYHYRVVNDIGLKWQENVISSARVGTIPDGSGKPGLSVGSGVGKTVTYDNDYTVGFRIYFDSQAGWGGQGPLYSFSAANRDPLAQVSIEHDGTVSLWAGNRHTLLANSGTFGFAIHGGTSYYVEINSVISGGTPMTAAVTLLINGSLVCNGSGSIGINTADTLLGNAEGNYHQFQDANIVNGKCWVRDVYIAGILGTFYGDIGLGAVFPYQDGSGSGFTPVGAGSLFGACNPQYPDINDDTIYITAGVVGNAQEFKFGPLTGNEPIPFVHFGVYHKKDAEGSRKFVLTMAGVTVSSTISSGDDYRYDFVALDRGPGSVPWTVALFNGTTFGVKIVA